MPLHVILAFVAIFAGVISLVWMFVHWGPQLPPVTPDVLIRNLEYRPTEEWSPTLHGEIWGDGNWWKFKLYGFGLIKVPDYKHVDGPVFMTEKHWKQAMQAFREQKALFVAKNS